MKKEDIIKILEKYKDILYEDDTNIWSYRTVIKGIDELDFEKVADEIIELLQDSNLNG